MQHNNRWPTEPPMTGYTRSTSERRLRLSWPAIISALCAAGIVLTVALVVVWTDSPAGDGGDRSAVISPPSSVPGPPVQVSRCGERPAR